MNAGSLLGRARRLTDTQIPPYKGGATAAAGEQHTHHSTGGSTISSSSGSTASPELLSVISCYGGGLEANKTVTVGNLRVTYSVHTHPGTDPGGNVKENQDAWCIQERLAGQDMALFGVFDGHGSEGKVVSHCLCTNLPRALSKMTACKPATLEAALSSVFPEANRIMQKQPGLDADLSGSTGIVAVLAQNKLVVGNLGDSRCVLGKVDAAGAVSAVALSADHTPLDPTEADRVIAAGGRIASFMCGSEPLGPLRVWLRDINVPGLCMTRSFGDLVAASVGVIDEPQIITATLRPEDRYVVLMSDGIFEFLDSQQVLEEVHRAASDGQPPSEAAKRLVRIARKCWQEQEAELIDDCTAMVLYLAPAPTGSGNGSGSGSTAHTAPAAGTATTTTAAAAAAGLAKRLDAGLKLGNKSSPGSAAPSGSGGSSSKGPGGLLGYKRG